MLLQLKFAPVARIFFRKELITMEYLKSIPKSDLILLLEVTHELLTARSPRQFQSCFKKLQRLILYDSSICIFSDKDTIKNKKPFYHYCTMNFSEEFAEQYAKEGYYEKSSVFKAVLKDDQPCHWKSYWSRTMDQNGIISMKLAHSYGYLDGWISANSYQHDPGVAFLVFAGQKVDSDQRTAAILKYITPHFAESIMDTFRSSIRRLKQYEQFKLTPRQLEVLNWIKEGKSAWDISIILNRSESAVIWHANNIMRKLCAQNRTHAVAIAMRQQLID
jgi:LuxR family transcriptional regulator, quorum-sensing system regulator CviR